MKLNFGTQESPQRRRPIAWYSPPIVWQAGREWMQSAGFQRNLDRRETLPPDLQPLDFSDRPASQAQPFGFDFLSDTGDGGNATFSVAQALLRRELRLSDPVSGQTLTLTEGELLVLGGDLAYPGASAEAYQYRFIEPLALARDPTSRFVPLGQGEGPRKFMAAIPQNHDWFDSASTFCRYFVNYDKGAVNGARTPQRQTWFAARLPHGFWLLGLDFALVGDLDRQQLEAFMGLLDPARAGGIRAGDDVLLLYPEPVWSRSLGDGASPGYPRRYQRLEAAIEAAGARIRLRLAGDSHHYLRETLAQDPLTQRDSHLLTCGLGGAFAHPTHCADVQASKVMSRSPEAHAASPDLHSRVRVGCTDGRDPGAQTFDKACVWPEPALTRRLCWGLVLALFRVGFSRSPLKLGVRQSLLELWHSNLGFALCLGLVYGLGAYLSATPAGAGLPWDAAASAWLQALLLKPLALLLNLGLLAGCVRIAWEGPGTAAARLASGLLHGLAHGLSVFALFWLSGAALQSAGLPGEGWAATVPFLAACALTGLGGVLAGGLLLGSYLALVCGVFGQLPNNAFGALAVQDYKGFLRCRITEAGLELVLVGLDRVPARGDFSADLAPGWRIVDRFQINK